MRRCRTVISIRILASQKRAVIDSVRANHMPHKPEVASETAVNASCGSPKIKDPHEKIFTAVSLAVANSRRQGTPKGQLFRVRNILSRFLRHFLEPFLEPIPESRINSGAGDLDLARFVGKRNPG